MNINAAKITTIIAVLYIFSYSTTGRPQAAPGDLVTSVGFTVTRGDDRNNAACVPGDCSLREAVNAANASPTEDTIDFAAGLTTITLTKEIVINNAGALTISGPGANILTIDGGAGTNRIFSANQATAAISGLTLTGGNGGGATHSGDGGAIFAQNCSLNLDGILVMGNTANGPNGGGGVVFSGGANRIINSTFSANTANFGGGVFMGGDTLTVVNSTISGNRAILAGGGFYISCYGCHATLRNATITNNTAREGGGIYEEAIYYTLDLGNTIFAGNVASLGPLHGPENYSECDTSCAAIISAGGNLVGDSPGDSTHTGAIAIAYQPSDIRDTDPLLGPLRNYGGPTPTHALKARSPVIDKGLNALAIDPFNGHKLSFDQRGSGYARIRMGNGNGRPIVDIGAFEFAAAYSTNLEELDSAVNSLANQLPQPT